MVNRISNETPQSGGKNALKSDFAVTRWDSIFSSLELSVKDFQLKLLMKGWFLPSFIRLNQSHEQGWIFSYNETLKCRGKNAHNFPAHKKA